MDNNLIFCKTPMGEAALAHSLNQVQRNLRLVLINVDAHTTVGALCQRMGNPVVVKYALAALEQAGFIETADARMARELAGARQPGRKAAAVTEKTPAPPTSEVDQIAREARRAVALGRGVAAGLRCPSPRVLPGKRTGGLKDRIRGAFELPEAAQLAAAGDTVVLDTMGAVSSVLPGLLPGEPVAAANVGRNAGVLVPLKPVPAGAAQGASGDGRASQGPFAEIVVDRSDKPRRRWWSALSGSVAIGGLVLVAGMVALSVFPFERYRPMLEGHLSAATAHPVEINALEFNLFPNPSFHMPRVNIGAQVRLAELKGVEFRPGIVSVLGYLAGVAPLKGVVHIDAARLTREGLHELVSAPHAHGPLRLMANPIHVEALQVTVGPEILVDGARLTAEISGGGRMSSFVAKDPRGAWTLRGERAGDDFRVVVGAQDWVLPVGAGIAVRRLEATGALSPGSLSLSDVRADVLDGRVEGNYAVVWQGIPSASADLRFSGLDAASLLDGVASRRGLSGKLDGRAQVRSKADSLIGLWLGWRASADVALREGRFEQFNPWLTPGARSVPARTAGSAFDSLRADLILSPEQVRAEFVRIESRAGQAEGTVSIDTEGEVLAGDLSIKPGGDAARPDRVKLGGTWSEPEVLR